jgi:formate hydrogenlyase transcriptional activator
MSNNEPGDNTTASSDQYQALCAVSETIAAQRDLSSLFHELGSRLGRVVSFDALSLVLHDTATNVMRLHVLELPDPLPSPSTITLSPDDDPAGLVWQTQQPPITSKLSDLERWPQLRQRLEPYGIQSNCWLPLSTARHRLGVLVFTCRQPAMYDHVNVHFL